MTDQDLQQLKQELSDLKGRFETHAHTQYDGTKHIKYADLEQVTGTSGSGAPTTSKYLLQAADASLPNAQDLSLLTGGLLKVGGGALFTAIAGTDYLTPAGSGSSLTGITASQISGTIDIINGGTGQTTASAAINALLPNQSGNNGKFLTTNGSATSWGTPTGSGTLATAGWFADGSDGDVTISADTTLARDMYYNNLTINTAVVLKPAGYKIFVKGTLTFNGTGKIQRNGNVGTGGNPAVAATPGTGGAGGAAILGGTLPAHNAGTTGGAGAAGNNGNSAVTGGVGAAGSSVTNALLSAGRTGNSGGASPVAGAGSGPGGAGGTINAALVKLANPWIANLMMSIYSGTLTFLQISGQNGGGGGGAGGPGRGGAQGGGGGGAGGSGSDAGFIILFANNIVYASPIQTAYEAIGGAGGPGGRGGNANTSGGGNGDGGGGGCGGTGGNGGYLAIFYLTKTNTFNYSVSAGAGGAGGTGGTGTNGTGSGTNGDVGQTGQAGSGGAILEYQIT